MRRYVAISVARRGDAAGVRLYEMDLNQRRTYDVAARALAAGGRTSPEQADKAVEHLVARCLGGGFDHRNLPRTLGILKDAFPRLTNAQVEALPVLGCPEGEVTAILIPMRARDGTARVARYDLDGGQQLWYADAMRRAVVMGGEDRDEAWCNINLLITRLLQGRQVRADADFIVQVAAGYFPALTAEQALALPVATEDDVRRLSFREVRPMGTGQDGPRPDPTEGPTP